MRVRAEDPLIYHGKLKAMWLIAYSDAVNTMRAEMDKISLPVLLIHGSEDHIISLLSSQFIHDNVSSDDKTFEVSWRW